MFHLDVVATLNLKQRRAVDRLILDVWSHEAEVGHDVEVLARQGVAVIDPLDDRSVHLLVWSGKQLVGYSRLSIFLTSEALNQAPQEVPRLDPAAISFKPVAYLSRLVVHPTARGQGVAKLMDLVRIEIAHDSGAKSVVLCAVGDIRHQALAHVGFASIKSYQSFQTGWYRTSRPTTVMKLQLSPLATRLPAASV